MLAPESPNLFIKIPGTEEGVPAKKEGYIRRSASGCILLFSCEQYLAAVKPTCVA